MEEPRAKKVLIVDDEEDVRNILSNLLQVLGYHTREEDDPLAVVDTIKEFNPDLMTLDFEMPQANGIEVINMIRKEGIKTPIIVISGYLDPDNSKKVSDLGITHVVSKPFRSSLLVQHIEGALKEC